MTRQLSISAVLAALGVATVLAGCGSSPQPARVVSSPVPEATATATAAATDHPDGDGDGIPDVITVKGRRGDTLPLEGSGLNDDVDDHTKTKLRVTLKRVRGPFTGFDIPANRRLIGVDLRFVNTGRLVYDNPQPQGVLTVAGGETGKQTSLIKVGGKNPCVNPRLKLKTGQSEDVCIAFEVPKAGKPQTFQYISDSGYGDTGLWTLR